MNWEVLRSPLLHYSITSFSSLPFIGRWTLNVERLRFDSRFQPFNALTL